MVVQIRDGPRDGLQERLEPVVLREELRAPPAPVPDQLEQNARRRLAAARADLRAIPFPGARARARAKRKAPGRGPSIKRGKNAALRAAAVVSVRSVTSASSPSRSATAVTASESIER